MVKMHVPVLHTSALPLPHSPAAPGRFLRSKLSPWRLWDHICLPIRAILLPITFQVDVYVRDFHMRRAPPVRAGPREPNAVMN